MKISFLIRFLLFMSIGGMFLACARNSTTEFVLEKAGDLCWTDPDAVLELIETLPFDSLNSENQARVILFKEHASFQLGKSCLDDSLLNMAVDHFRSHGETKLLTLSYLLQGYRMMNVDSKTNFKDYSNKIQHPKVQALLLFKEAEKTMTSVSDKRVHFLVLTALGKLNAEVGLYDLAVSYYKKAVDLNLNPVVWKKGNEGWYLSPYWIKLNPASYNREVLLQFEKLTSLINSMDFDSKDKIYYQWALSYKEHDMLDKAEEFMNLALKMSKNERLKTFYRRCLAKIYESDGSHSMQADSLNRIVLISPFSDYKIEVYKDQYTKSLNQGKKEKTILLLLKCIDEQVLMLASPLREYLYMQQKKYDYDSLRYELSTFKHRWIIFMMVGIVVFATLCLIVVEGKKYYHLKQLELLSKTKKDIGKLQIEIDRLKEVSIDKAEDAAALYKKIACLEREKKDKEVRVRQLEVTFRAKDIHLNVEELEAVQVYLKLTDAVNPEYVPSDRPKLIYWLNRTQKGSANALLQKYPSLTFSEQDLCYLCMLGISFEQCSTVLGIQLRSVDRSIYRICKKMGLLRGNKQDFLNELYKLKEA